MTEETGNTVQARTSFLPSEILWGHRFVTEPVQYNKVEGAYMVQHGAVSRTEADPATPRMSARQMDTELAALDEEEGQEQ